YVQSERIELYQEYAQQLIDSGHAYHCFCSTERLEKLREEQKREKKGQGYDRHCRNLGEEERQEYLRQGIKPVVRFKVPLEGSTVFEDILLGEMKKKNKDIPPDPVLLKSDGYPTYHLANVVDDHLMEISHIMRAQEWIPSGPLHVLLYQAFGWPVPRYCHLPMVMGKDGRKLSKRHGATSVIEFRRQGYLPEAVLNYITLLGWSYDDKREFFRRQELERLFSLEKLSKAPAVFDYKKLEWFNGQYIREKSTEELIELLLPYMQAENIVGDPPTEGEMKIIRDMMPLMKERLHFLKDISELSRFLFQDVTEYKLDEVIPKKLDAAKTLEVLEAARGIIAEFESRGEERTEELLRTKAEELEVKLGAMMMPIRVAVTGSRVSPPLLGSIRLLGVEKTLERIDRVISILRSEV
ncbi:MAG TPA: glutamate--tRNA ligase, partial [Sediminispirochaeta sp.]|nr:glutamate--tRNA ligase [Sediminispirochaeta sp.]